MNVVELEVATIPDKKHAWQITVPRNSVIKVPCPVCPYLFIGESEPPDSLVESIVEMKERRFLVPTKDLPISIWIGACGRCGQTTVAYFDWSEVNTYFEALAIQRMEEDRWFRWLWGLEEAER